MRLQRDCRAIEPMLWNYAARTLPEEERARVETHLGACPACCHQAEEYRVTVSLATDFRDAAVPDSETNWNDLLARMEARAAKPAPASARRPRFALPLWGGAVLAAALVVFCLLPRPRSQSEHKVAVVPAPPAPLVPHTGAGEGGKPGIRSAQKGARTTVSVSPLPVRATDESERGAGGEGRARNLRPEERFRESTRPKHLLANRKQKQAERRVTQNTPAEKRTSEPEPKSYFVDGERSAGSDLSQHYIAYSAPSGETSPGQPAYVMDTIPVSTSSPRPVSAGAEARELQAW